MDGPVTASLEARALNHKNDLVDIYSASWGPRDDGMTMVRPKEATKRALAYGVKEVSHFIVYCTTFVILSKKYIIST